MGHAVAAAAQDREQPRGHIGRASVPTRPVTHSPIRHTQVAGKWRLPPGAVKRLAYFPQSDVIVPHFRVVGKTYILGKRMECSAVPTSIWTADAIKNFASRPPLRRGRQRDPITEVPKGSITTGQQDHLHPRRGLRQNFGHEIKPSIIRIDERIV